MEKVTRGLPESPARRAARIARVGARYGFGNRFVPRRRRAEPGRVGTRLRLSFEDLGPTFAEFGRFLAARRDLLSPDVAVELEQTAVVVKPLPFAETRALVVVVRTGVRRDLLAMRPVADLTRRRLRDRLPLDPTEAVTEFAAHAAHRRDMFFAAQTARRLKEMEELRVPDVYRDYSTGRCVTFEAPAGPVPLEVERYREVSEVLVRLALAEGIFLADLTPERFAVDGSTGELWLADPTEAFSLDPERLRGVAEVLAAVRREDVDGVARTLPLAGSFVPRDDSILRRELREALGSLGGPLWREHSLEEIRDRGLEAVRRGGARLHVEVVQMMRALVEAEGLGGRTEVGAAAEA